MTKTLNAFIRLCLFKGSPAELPYSVVLLTVFLVIKLVYQYVSLGPFRVALAFGGMAEIIISVVIVLGLIYALLAYTKNQNRYLKLLLGWFGTDVILTVILLGALISIATSMPSLAYLIRIASLGVYVWSFIIKGYMLKLTLGIRMTSALLLVFALLFFSELPISIQLLPYSKQMMPT